MKFKISQSKLFMISSAYDFNGQIMLIECRLQLLLALVRVYPRCSRDLNFIFAITIAATIVIPLSFTNATESRRHALHFLLYFFQDALVKSSYMRYSDSFR